MKGSFTMEMAMIFPMILFIYIFLIYIGLFQYERCVAEQNLCYALLRGKEVHYLEREGKETFMKEMYDSIALERGIVTDWDAPEFEVQTASVCGNISGELLVLNSLRGDGMRGGQWEWNISKKFQMLSPVEFIRFYNRWKGK